MSKALTPAKPKVKLSSPTATVPPDSGRLPRRPRDSAQTATGANHSGSTGTFSQRYTSTTTTSVGTVIRSGSTTGSFEHMSIYVPFGIEPSSV